MKKIIVLILCIIMLLSISIPVFAGDFDDMVDNVGDMFKIASYSSAEAYGCKESQRAMCLSPDGKYLFASYLFGYAGIVKYDAQDLSPKGYYYTNTEYKRFDEFKEEKGEAHFMSRNLVCDDRGYLITCLCSYENFDKNAGIAYEGVFEDINYFYVVVIDYVTMTEVARYKYTMPSAGIVMLNGTHLDIEDGKYTLYCATNFDFTDLVAFDISNINDIHVDTSFGTNGHYNYQNIIAQLEKIKDLKGTDHNKESEIYCFDRDEDGNFYFAMRNEGYGSKHSKFDKHTTGDFVVKTDKDFKVLSYYDLDQCFGVDYYKGYLFVCTYVYATPADCWLYILDPVEMEIIKEIEAEDEAHGEWTSVVVTDNKVYIADQRSYDESTRKYNDKFSFYGLLVNFTESNCYHTNHEIRNKVDATCKDNGYSGDVYCADCGELIQEGHVTLPNQDHHFVNGICTVCLYEDPDYEANERLTDETAGFDIVGLTGKAHKAELKWLEETDPKYVLAQNLVKDATGVAVFDLTLFDKYDEKVQPSGSVTVSINMPESLLNAEGDKYTLYHYNETFKTYEKISGNDAGEKMVFSTSSLSPFAIVKEKEIEEPIPTEPTDDNPTEPIEENPTEVTPTNDTPDKPIDEKEEKSTLPIGLILGIAGGALVVIVVVVIIVVKNKKKK